MQINYPSTYERDRSGFAPMWFAPNPDADLRDLIVPPIYAPYGTQPFWPPSTAQSAIAMSGLGNGSPSPAPTPNAATAPGQSLAPISLVSPMPSITSTPVTSVASDQMPPTPGGWCAIENWVNQNPGLAAVSALLVFFAVRGGHK